jgi:hypothetical protein
VDGVIREVVGSSPIAPIKTYRTPDGYLKNDSHPVFVMGIFEKLINQAPDG